MAGEDDLLDPSEIEALLAQANGGIAPQPPAKKTASPPAETEKSENLLNSSDIDALLRERNSSRQEHPAAQTGKTPSTFRPASSTEQLLNQAEASLAAALAPNLMGTATAKNQNLSGATTMELKDLLQTLSGGEKSELSLLQDVELDLRIELGRTELLIEEVVSLKPGSVVPLDKLAGDPVDILVNGKLIARGEVLVLNDNFCVRVAEILTPRE